MRIRLQNRKTIAAQGFDGGIFSVDTRQMNTTRVSNFFIEIRVVSYAENLDLLGFSVFLYFHAVFLK